MYCMIDLIFILIMFLLLRPRKKVKKYKPGAKIVVPIKIIWYNKDNDDKE